MPMPRRKSDRLRQIHRWLSMAHPTPWPTRLRVESLTPRGKPVVEYGDASLYEVPEGNYFVLRVEKRLRWHTAIEVLLHEYAHAMAWPAGELEKTHPDHSEEWGLAYSRIYRDFYDEGGCEEARDFAW